MEQINMHPKTYPEMNSAIVEILRYGGDSPLHLYAAQLIEEQAATIAEFSEKYRCLRAGIERILTEYESSGKC